MRENKRAFATSDVRKRYQKEKILGVVKDTRLTQPINPTK